MFWTSLFDRWNYSVAFSRCEISFELNKQEVQSLCDDFRQRGVEMIDRTHNKWFSIETLSEELKASLFDSLLCHFPI